MEIALFDSWLEESVSEVLESMFFLSCEVIPLSTEDAGTTFVDREVDFTGPHKGHFGIRMALSTAQMLASNFLGQEPEELTEVQNGEVVGEVANMICGAILGRMDSKQAFVLSPPHAGHSAVDSGHGAVQFQSMFALDEGTLTAWFSLEHSL